MVDEKQFIQNFADQFDDEPEGLTLETRFRDIDGWSSIIALSEMAMCDEEYDVGSEMCIRDRLSSQPTRWRVPTALQTSSISCVKGIRDNDYV